MAVIQAQHYRDTVAALMADPIIIAMVEDLRSVPREELAHEDGHPRHHLMVAALDTYKARGGAIPSHIGGPAEALLALLDA